MAKKYNYNYDDGHIYSVHIRCGDGPSNMNNLCNCTGFTNLRSARKYARTHGMKGDSYTILSCIPNHPSVTVDSGTVGGNLKDKKGKNYTLYHYLNSNKQKKNNKGGK